MFGRKKKTEEGQPEAAPDATLKGEIIGVPIKYSDAGVLRIGRRKFAVKLNWTALLKDMPLKEQAQDPSSAVDIPGGQSSAPVVAVKSADQNFVGFAADDLGHRNGMPALALSVDTEITGENWAGIFPIEGEGDMFWIGAVQSDGVFEDDIVQGIDRAEEVFSRISAVPGWNAIFAPASWNVEDSEDVPLSEILLAKPKQRLKFIQPIKARLKLIIGFSVVFTIAALGLNFVNKQLEEQRREQERIATLARQAIDIGPEDYPWYAAPTPVIFVETCLAEIEKKIAYVPGWEISPYICRFQENGSSLTSNWQRRGGTSSWLRASVENGNASFFLDEAAGSGTLIQSFDYGQDFKRLDEPWTPEDITLRVTERFQPFEEVVRVEIRAEIDRPRPVGRTEIPRPVYNKHDVILNGIGDPEKYVELFGDIPAVVPSVFTYNIATNEWTLAASIQHDVIIPEIRR